MVIGYLKYTALQYKDLSLPHIELALTRLFLSHKMEIHSCQLIAADIHTNGLF